MASTFANGMKSVIGEDIAVNLEDFPPQSKNSSSYPKAAPVMAARASPPSARVSSTSSAGVPSTSSQQARVPARVPSTSLQKARVSTLSAGIPSTSSQQARVPSPSSMHVGVSFVPHQRSLKR